MIVIEANSLSKNYGNFYAVDKLSLQVNSGEIYGFLGLNGAGKTTTIRMLLDMIRPSGGSVRLFEKRLKSGDPLWNHIGYLVETPYSYSDLTVEENLRICFEYRRLKNKEVIESVIQQLSLHPYKNVKAKNLSLGNNQRLGLAKALFHNPKLLILDEPTNGLDPAGIVEVRNLLKRLAAEGSTIFISSHILGEVSKLATRMGIIHQGKLIREVFTKDLEMELTNTLVIKTGNNERAINFLKEIGYSFAPNDGESISSKDILAIQETEQIAAKIIQSGVGLKELFINKEDLESYFLRLIEKEN